MSTFVYENTQGSYCPRTNFVVWGGAGFQFEAATPAMQQAITLAHLDVTTRYRDFNVQWKAVWATLVFMACLGGDNDKAWELIDHRPEVQVNAYDGTLYLAKTGYPTSTKTFLY